jgi:hypothetical protein
MRGLLIAHYSATAGFRTAESNIEGLNQSVFERFFEVLEPCDYLKDFAKIQNVKMKLLFSLYQYRQKHSDSSKQSFKEYISEFVSLKQENSEAGEVKSTMLKATFGFLLVLLKELQGLSGGEIVEKILR